MISETTTLYKLAAISDSPLILMPGGTSSGKTIAILLYLISISQTQDHKLISIMTDTAPALRDGAMRDFRTILRETNITDQYQQNKTDKIYTNLYTGSQIQFVALDDELKARGGRRDYLYVNEANRIGWTTFEQLHVRTRVQTICDWNPSGRFWAYDRYLENPEAKAYKSCTTTYLDNEALDPNTRQTIEAHDHSGNWWRVYGLGQLGELENNVYKGWKRIDRLPETRELVCYGIDYGNSPDPTAMVCVWRDTSDGTIIFEQVFELANLLIRDQAELVKREIDNRGDAVIYCDYGGGGASLIAELHSMGLMAVNADKQAGSVLAGIEAVRSIPSVAYLGKDLEREYLGYQHRVKRGSGEILPEPKDGDDHLMDALRYAWYSAAREDREIRDSERRATMYGKSDGYDLGDAF